MYKTWRQFLKYVKSVDMTMFTEARFPKANSVELRQNFL